ncbi:MAG: hypothetical protein V9E83_00175 [Baekduia sp.]
MTAYPKILALTLAIGAVAAPAQAADWTTQTLGSPETNVEQTAIAPDGSALALVGSQLHVDYGAKRHAVYTKTAGSRFTRQLQLNGYADYVAGIRSGGQAILASSGADDIVLRLRPSASSAWRTVKLAADPGAYWREAPQLVSTPGGRWIIAATQAQGNDTPDDADEDIITTVVYEVSATGEIRFKSNPIPNSLNLHGLAATQSGAKYLLTEKPSVAGEQRVGTTVVYSYDKGKAKAISAPLPITNAAVAAGVSTGAIVGTDPANCQDVGECVGRTLHYRITSGGQVLDLGQVASTDSASAKRLQANPAVTFLSLDKIVVSWDTKNRQTRAFAGRRYAFISTTHPRRAPDAYALGETGDYPAPAADPLPLSGNRVFMTWATFGTAKSVSAKTVNIAENDKQAPALNLGRLINDGRFNAATGGSWAIVGGDVGKNARRATVSVRRF